MAVEITGKYIGNLKTELTHGPSGMVIRTAAPVDNQGDGSSFSPTDLAAASLGACMLTLIAIVGERDGLDLTGLCFRLEKHMEANPRRIGAIPVTITHAGRPQRGSEEEAGERGADLPGPQEPRRGGREAGRVRLRGRAGGNRRVKKLKLLKRALASSRNFQFDEFVTLVEAFGFRPVTNAGEPSQFFVHP